MFGNQGVERAEPFAQHVREPEQSERVPRGSRVHDDAAVGAALRQGRQLDERHQLIETRQGQVQELADVVVVQERSALGDLPQVPGVRRLELAETLLGVQFAHLEVRRPRRARQAVLERVGGVSRGK